MDVSIVSPYFLIFLSECRGLWIISLFSSFHSKLYCHKVVKAKWFAFLIDGKHVSKLLQLFCTNLCIRPDRVSQSHLINSNVDMRKWPKRPSRNFQHENRFVNLRFLLKLLVQTEHTWNGPLGKNSLQWSFQLF